MTAVARINLWLRKSVADDSLNITIHSQEHTEHIWRQWFELRLRASERTGVSGNEEASRCKACKWDSSENCKDCFDEEMFENAEVSQ